MNGAVRLGRVAGIPLAANWSSLLMPVLVAAALGGSVLPQTVRGAGAFAYWLTAVAVALAFLACLVAHELAHALTARRQGLRVSGITLWMLGGVTAIEDEPASAPAEFRLAVAGPATSLVCGVASAVLAVAAATVHAPKVAVVGAVWLAATNGLLAVFNMLPGAPLDGGRVLHAWVWHRTHDRRRATEVASRAGRTTGLGLVFLGAMEAMLTSSVVGGVWLALIGWFLMSAASAERTNVEAESALHGLPVSAAMDSRVTIVPSYQSVSAAARTAVAADADYCPVTEFDGRIVGVVDVNRLVHASLLPASSTVATIAQALTADGICSPDAPLLDTLRRNSGRLPIVVMEDRLVVGLVTPQSLNHALRRGLVQGEPVG